MLYEVLVVDSTFCRFLRSVASKILTKLSAKAKSRKKQNDLRHWKLCSHG